MTLRLDPRLIETALPAAPSDAADVDLPARQRIEEWLKESVDGDNEPWRTDAAQRLMDSGFDIVPVGLDDAVSDGCGSSSSTAQGASASGTARAT